MKIIPPGSVDMVFADPPYRISRGGVTVKSGRLAPVDKGDWDRSMGFAVTHRFNVRWLQETCRILKLDGTIWVTGTRHIIFSLGFALQSLKFKVTEIRPPGPHRTRPRTHSTPPSPRRRR
jgi:site-specific DNA-methyltransferase (adenine-specific)